MKRTTMVILAMLASCDAEEASTEDAKLGPLAFEVPADWQRMCRAPAMWCLGELRFA